MIEFDQTGPKLKNRPKIRPPGILPEDKIVGREDITQPDGSVIVKFVVKKDPSQTTAEKQDLPATPLQTQKTEQAFDTFVSASIPKDDRE